MFNTSQLSTTPKMFASDRLGTGQRGLRETAEKVHYSRKGRQNEQMCHTHHQFAHRPEEYYAITVVDRDHPVGSHVQAIALNIPALIFQTTAKEMIDNAFPEVSYILPYEQPDLTNNHRYQVSVYRQPAKIATGGKVYPDEARNKFPMREFEDKNKLELVSRQEYEGAGGEGEQQEGKAGRRFGGGGLGLFLGGAALGTATGALLL